MEDINTIAHLLQEQDPVPTSITIQEAFGLPSQMTIQGFTPGHPLTPEKNPNYIWSTPLVKDIIEWLAAPVPDPLWITGPTGCGKTEMVVQLAASLQLPTVIVSAKKSTELEDILGRITLKDGNTVFTPGALPLAYRKGFFIVFDEVDAYPPEVMMGCHRMLEKKPVVLDDGTIFLPARRVLMAATANTRGDGEGGDLYTATNIFNLATLNRFEKWTMDYPAPEVEAAILKRHLPTLDDRVIEAMVKSAKDIRVSHEQGHCPGPISVRDLIRWGGRLLISANRTDVKPVYHSFDKAFGNGVNRHVRSALHKIVQSHFNVPAPAI
jgi:cobaltochelatase CobS